MLSQHGRKHDTILERSLSVGSFILQETESVRREFEYVQGPLFANIVLADEINRAPSKTQAAML